LGVPDSQNLMVDHFTTRGLGSGGALTVERAFVSKTRGVVLQSGIQLMASWRGGRFVGMVKKCAQVRAVFADI